MPAPDPVTLRRFLLGDLPADEAVTVEAFLDTHPDAATALDQLPAEDALTAALRGRTGDPAVPPEAEALARCLEALSGDLTRTAGGADSSELTGERTVDDLTAFLTPPHGPDELGRLGDFRILRVLGRGGMGVVFEAEDVKLGRRVAVKVMLPKLAADPTAKHRFLREAKAAAAVEHDHVVPIHLIAEAAGVPFLVMPFLKGESLDDRLKREGTLPVPEVLRIGREIAEGLAAAHDRGLVHRDIKPANLWLEGARGRVKILDFGLARPATPTGDGAEITQSGAVVGTPAYMSPEQGRGLPVDFRTDLFSLGGVLYRACTGRTPFSGADAASVLMSLAADTPEDPRALNPAVPPGLSTLIRRLLEKDPAKRPPSASEVARQLSPTVEPLPAEAEGPRSEFAFDGDETEEIPPAIDLPEPARKRSRVGRRIAVATAALAVGIALYFAPTIVRVATNKGELVIEVDDPNIEVAVKGADAEVRDKSKGRTYVLKAGDGEVEFLDPEGGAGGLTRTFRITRGGKTLVKATMAEVVAARQPRKSNPSVAAGPPPRVVASDYRVVHGVSLTELQAWGKEIQVAGLRPTWIAARSGASKPTFDAIAVSNPDAVPWRLEFMDDEPTQGDGPWKKNRSDGYGLSSVIPFRSAKGQGAISIWVAGGANQFASWHGTREFVESKLKNALEKRWQITSIAAHNTGQYDRWRLEYKTAVGGPFEYRLDLAEGELPRVAEEFRARGWYPRIVSAVQNRKPLRYGALFEENLSAIEWDLQVGLTTAALEKELIARKAQGLWPRCVCSHEAEGKVGYTIVWSGLAAGETGPSPARWTGDQPPPKDLFPGTLAEFLTFDDPEKSPLPLGTKEGRQFALRDGMYESVVPDAKARQGTGNYFGRTAGPDVGFVVRCRRENAALVVNFRHRATAARWTWLEFRAEATGDWGLFRVAAAVIPGALGPRTVARLAGSEKADADLGQAHWVTLCGRATETDFELWANGRLLARGPVGEALEGTVVDSVGVEVAAFAAADGRFQFELDHVAVWKLPAVESPDPLRWTGEKPPPKSLLPGEVLAYETFDDAKATTAFVGTRNDTRHAVEKGAYVLDRPVGPKDTFVSQVFGPPDAEVAFAVRLRVTGAIGFVNFGGRVTPTGVGWLAAQVHPDGTWAIYRRERTRKDGQLSAIQSTRLASSDAANPDLAAGKWVTLTGRAVGSEYEVSANGRRLAGGADGPAAGGPIKTDQLAVELGGHQAPGPIHVEVDWLAVWKLPAASGSDRYRNLLGMEFARIPKGKAWLGGGAGKPGVREVEFKDDFYLGVYEVTQEEWEKVTGLNPSGFKAVAGVAPADQKRFPVERVTWAECQAYIARLNEREPNADWKYRLPTEDEWEYACRGGPMWDRFDSVFDYYLDQPQDLLLPGQANFKDGNGLKRTCKVGSYKPNKLGLYDMHGNVWEFCDDELPADPRDPKEGPRRLQKGGDWLNGQNWCRASERFVSPPSLHHDHLGLRVARVRVGTTSTSPPAPAALTAAQRKALEWVLSVGGRLALLEAGKTTSIGPGDLLPDRPVVVGTINLGQVKSFAGVEALRDSPPVNDNVFLGPAANDQVLARLATYPGIAQAQKLHLDGPGFGDAALTHARAFPRLTDLTLVRTAVTPAGLDRLPDLKVSSLTLRESSQFDDRSLPAVARLSGLVRLWLDGTAVTDAGLDHLAGLSKLTFLVVAKTKVTKAGAQKLAAALPACKVEYDGGEIGPTKK